MTFQDESIVGSKVIAKKEKHELRVKRKRNYKVRLRYKVGDFIQVLLSGDCPVSKKFISHFKF